MPAPIRNFLRPYSAYFRSRGWEVYAAADRASDDPALIDAFDSVYDLSSSRSLRHPGPIIRGLPMLRALARSLEPDVIHVSTPIAGFVTRLTLGRSHTPKDPAIVYTAHGFHAFDGGSRARNAFYSIAEATAGRWTDALIVINDEDERRALQWHMVPRSRLVHMPGIGVDVSHYDVASLATHAGSEFRVTTRIPDDARVFVMIAELHAAKRPLDAINAFSRMATTDAHLAILGEGPMEADMRRLAEHNGTADRIHFCGFLDDIRPALMSATASLLTSAREGLPRALMESLSMGIPVVTTAARGCAEVVGDAGIVVAVGDVSAIALALDAMDKSSPSWSAMSTQGRSRMVERFDLHLLLAMHERLYGALLNSRSRRLAV